MCPTIWLPDSWETACNRILLHLIIRISLSSDQMVVSWCPTTRMSCCCDLNGPMIGLLTLLNFSPSCFGSMVRRLLNPELMDCIRLLSLEFAISLRIFLSVSTWPECRLGVRSWLWCDMIKYDLTVKNGRRNNHNCDELQWWWRWWWCPPIQNGVC